MNIYIIYIYICIETYIINALCAAQKYEAVK